MLRVGGGNCSDKRRRCPGRNATCQDRPPPVLRAPGHARIPRIAPHVPRRGMMLRHLRDIRGWPPSCHAMHQPCGRVADVRP